MGPEVPTSTLEQKMRGTRWDGTGVGYGVRGARLPELTVRLEDVISLYREKTPNAPILFNYSPNSALWAIERRFPLAENCTGKPGRDLVSENDDLSECADIEQGFEVICDICG
jgi:hypothetical protein